MNEKLTESGPLICIGYYLPDFLFPDLHCDKPVNFSGAHFTETIAFNIAQFTKEANFHNAKFTDISNFSGAKFTKANFSEAQFTEIVGTMSRHVQRKSCHLSEYGLKKNVWLCVNF